MFERGELGLKILCGAMGLLLVYRLVLVVAHINPLYHLAIPALPTLASAEAKPAQPQQGQTNTPATNLAQSAHFANAGHPTNGAASQAPAQSALSTNATASNTNLPAGATNALAAQAQSPTPGTNSAVHSPPMLARVDNPSNGHPAHLARMGLGPMMGPGGMPGQPNPGPPLPGDVQARIDRVIESEIIAPVMHPLPMALLGIAGNDVFLRAPNGQTGLIKEGEELGGVKLLRIGVNRVLVEEQGERKELTIFAGLGGDSLLSPQKENAK